jgi:hypothetical protein
MTSALDSPLWRVVGSAGSWLVFAFSFTAFVVSMFAVLGVGGTCASGGPFVIAVECPDGSSAFTLLGVYGALGAVVVALIVARDFGTRLVALAWPILFLTLGGVFAVIGGAGFAQGGWPFALMGVLFLVMALVPLVFELRASPQRTFLGVADLAGRRFRERQGARTSMTSKGIPNPPDAVEPAPGDWTLSLALAVVPAAVGVALALVAWGAATGS